MIKADFEKYLCVYLADNKKLEEVQILFNFNKELHDASYKAYSDIAFQVRIKWMLDAINSIYNHKSTGYKIIDALIPLIERYQLTKINLIKMIEPRVVDKDQYPFHNQSALITYAKNTGGLLWEIIMILLGGKSIKSRKIANLIGTAFAILGIIRNCAFSYQYQRYTVVFAVKELTQDELLLEIVLNIKNLIKEVKILHQEATNLIKTSKLPKKLKCLTLLRIFTEGYIKNLERAEYNPFRANVIKIPKKYILKIIFRYLF